MIFSTLGVVFLTLLSREWVAGANVAVLYDRNSGQYYMPVYGKMYRVERSDYEGTSESQESYGDYYSPNGVSGDYDSQGHGSSGFQPSLGHYESEGGSQHQEISSFGGYGDSGSGYDATGAEGYSGGHEAEYGAKHHYVHSVPVSEHVEVTKPVAVPVYKEIGVPVPQPVKIQIPHPVAVGVPQPYPVAVPVSKPFPVQVVKTVAVPVEKKVPYPVEKHIPVPVEKPVPITIERHIPVPVEKPYPIKIPVYKTIYHHGKSHRVVHSHGH